MPHRSFCTSVVVYLLFAPLTFCSCRHESIFVLFLQSSICLAAIYYTQIHSPPFPASDQALENISDATSCLPLHIRFDIVSLTPPTSNPRTSWTSTASRGKCVETTHRPSACTSWRGTHRRFCSSWVCSTLRTCRRVERTVRHRLPRLAGEVNLLGVFFGDMKDRRYLLLVIYFRTGFSCVIRTCHWYSKLPEHWLPPLHENTIFFYCLFRYIA